MKAVRLMRSETKKKPNLFKRRVVCLNACGCGVEFGWAGLGQSIIGPYACNSILLLLLKLYILVLKWVVCFTYIVMCSAYFSCIIFQLFLNDGQHWLKQTKCTSILHCVHGEESIQFHIGLRNTGLAIRQSLHDLRVLHDLSLTIHLIFHQSQEYFL